MCPWWQGQEAGLFFSDGGAGTKLNTPLGDPDLHLHGDYQLARATCVRGNQNRPGLLPPTGDPSISRSCFPGESGRCRLLESGRVSGGTSYKERGLEESRTLTPISPKPQGEVGEKKGTTMSFEFRLDRVFT